MIKVSITIDESKPLRLASDSESKVIVALAKDFVSSTHIWSDVKSCATSVVAEFIANAKGLTLYASRDGKMFKG